MKCDKCGFVSFDHLAECRRCGAGVEATRERLGFSQFKSEVPFLLGTLLKNVGPRETAKAGCGGEPGRIDRDRTAATELESPVKAESSPATLTVPPEVDKEASRPEKEELIIELSEEDLESFAGAKGSLRPKTSGKAPLR